MSGGISAIKGFDYQATVILDLILSLFGKFGAAAEVRPEGGDDLDMFHWIGDEVYSHHVQIKKPRENKMGALAPSPWTLGHAVDELFTKTIRNLEGNNHQQSWILGDDVEPELLSLINSDVADRCEHAAFLKLVHALARKQSLNFQSLPAKPKRQLERWQPQSGPSRLTSEEIAATLREFIHYAAERGIPRAETDCYQESAQQLICKLPDILARITIVSSNGTEDQVGARVCATLEQRYTLHSAVVKNTLFPNLRSFVSDIAKQVNVRLCVDKFERKIIDVWPTMIVVKSPPVLDFLHIDRFDVANSLAISNHRVLEVVGASGSGKSSLAAEAISLLKRSKLGHVAFYLEIRNDTTFRDAMVGVAFHLRSHGVASGLRVATQGALADEQAIRSFAKLLPAIEMPVSLFFDLVDGSCNAGFARELAKFSRLLSPGNLRLVIMGQERALRNLSEFERESHGIGQVDVRGFHFDEFMQLVMLHQFVIDRVALYEIFERVTSGRSAGLIARLAMSLAQTASVEKMRRIASLDPEKMLVAADRERFLRLTSRVIQAASKLLCFALPFRQKDAVEIFRHDNVGAAIREMLDLGLLRPHGNDMFEMHETIRAGLEQDIPLSDRQSAHAGLATWYRTQGNPLAEILHLDKAGKESDAHLRAREVFLSGRHWGALIHYISDHDLVTGDEAADLLLESAPGASAYLLPALFSRCGDRVVGEKLLQQLTLHAERFESDYSWALAVSQSVLRCDRSKLPALLGIALSLARRSGNEGVALDSVQLALRRADMRLDSSAVAYFRQRDETDKILLLPVLLQDGQRSSYHEAFRIIDTQRDLSANKNHSWHINRALRLDSLDSVIEFLSALPAREVSEMLANKSVLLEPYGALLWSQKPALLRYAVEIVQMEGYDPVARYNAARVLACLAEHRLLTVCDPLTARDEKLRTLFQFLPALVPWLIDVSLHRNRLLDTKLALGDRVVSLNILLRTGENLASLLNALQLCNDGAIEYWRFLFLIHCAEHPFEAALPLLTNYVEAAPDSSLSPALIVSFGSLRSERVTEVLIDLLHHERSEMRIAVAQALAQQRSAQALSALNAQVAVETDANVAQAIVVAIIASHPENCTAVARASMKFPDAKIWLFVLASRLRDPSVTSEIIAVSTCAVERWQLRRAAILAAGKLPFACALEKIYPRVLAERSPFSNDESGNLYGHQALLLFLDRGVSALFTQSVHNRKEFIRYIAHAFDNFCRERMFAEGIPAGRDAATWLFNRFVYHGFPGNPHALDAMLNELRVPILHAAILRSLRLCGRIDLIVASLREASSLWFAARCVGELARARITTPMTREQIVNAAKSSGFYSTLYLQRVVLEFFGPLKVANVASSEPAIKREQSSPSKVVITASDVFAALADHSISIDMNLPIVILAGTVNEFERLIVQLNPANDYVHGGEEEAAVLRFTSTGYSVGSGRTPRISNRADVRAALRPAIAAADRWGIGISWHDRLLSEDNHSTYTRRFLKSLVAQEDHVRFFEELCKHEDILMPYICESRETASTACIYTDPRMVQSISRYVASGTDSFLEGLCTVAAGIDIADIDPVLDALFERWIKRFDLTKKDVIQHGQNYELWRAFDRISEHPRFLLVRQWATRLQVVMQVELPGHHRSQVMRVLERSANVYGFVESTLFKTSSFELVWRDQVDILDEAAERLFIQ